MQHIFLGSFVHPDNIEICQMDIHIEYVFFGIDLKPADLERAIELSTTKYCAISAMLNESVNITHSYQVKEPAGSAVADEMPA